MHDFLIDILAHKRLVNRDKISYYAAIKSKLSLSKVTRYQLFKKAISNPAQLNLIAEIKKASPSVGLIREDFDALDIAKIYEKSGAQALSILTEDKYFLGKPAYIQKVSTQVKLPILTKDFIVDEGQIYEAAVMGASAVLLIVAILENAQLKHFIEVASNLDLDCLVEIHDEEELERALKVGAEIIGINNRNLKSFKVDIKNCQQLIPKIPKGKIIVAESGIKSYEDVKILKDLGAHAVLIGETFMRENDIGMKVNEVMRGVKNG